MSDLPEKRREYAELVRANGRVQSEALVTAFATVPREHYLGPGPWRIVEPGRGYCTSEDDDPRHLYRDVLVAIDEARRLNNGQPSGLASWFDKLDLRPGDRVAHVGCGVGYYTAILAEVVGKDGSVLGVEIDPGLAKRAAANLSHYAHVRVAAGDGGQVPLGERDAIFINAGATRPRAAWIDALVPGGRLVLPLTVTLPDGSAGVGHMLRVVRTDTRPVTNGWGARFVSPVGIFPCAGARNDGEERTLSEAYRGGGESAVRSLRRDDHARDDACWLHGPGLCLSAAEPGG